ncbi:unnamed protein product [Urochloa decumbens]|uniref:Uncharacterized protein n=1 Tax=Urochloa decumbens TaxID=240449 RepID=A0ABC9AW53_9POAL
MAVSGGSGKRPWLVDVEKTLDEADASVEVSQWQRHSIYRVPACIKDLKPRAYRPQVVSLGPLHHGDPELVPMEEHKRRALRHLFRRANQPLEAFAAAVEEVVEQLQSAYLDIDDRWRGEEGRERFLEIMIMDGCFLLEVMRAASLDGRRSTAGDYAPNDPIFSHHGVLYMVPYIRRDMLILENQVPLLLLEKLLAVETGKPPTGGSLIRLHPLDVRRRSLLYGYYQALRWDSWDQPETDIIRPAVELREAGILFKRANSDSLHNIRFRNGVLTMPAVTVDNSTEHMFLNMMAFERLHVGAGNGVTDFVFFMDSIIKSSKDVALLSSYGIIQNAVGSDEAVVRLFASISKDVVLERESALEAVRRTVNAYCNKPWNKWRANIIHNYFRSPTSFLNFLAAVTALVMTVIQTAYTIMAFYNQFSSTAQPEAPAPM